jgi:hypothetical protein
VIDHLIQATSSANTAPADTPISAIVAGDIRTPICSC